MNDYITKPIDPEKMIGKIKKYVGQNHHTESLNETSELKKEGLDVQDGLHRVRGKEAIYHEILTAFKNLHLESETEIRKALESSDLSTAILKAHTLKGVASNIGAHELARIAGNIQKLLEENGRAIEIEKNLELLGGELKLVKADIDEYLAVTFL